MVQLRGVCIFLLCVLSVLARNPGFKARITSKGLNYANDVAIQALTENVQKLKIPDQSGKDGKVKYDVTSIRVTKFTAPASKISTNPGKGLKWAASNAGISIEGNWHYHWFFVSDRGSFDSTVSGLSFTIDIAIGDDATGRPSIVASGCSSHIDKVDFKFHGGASWLYNLFKKNVANKIKDTLNEQMCTLINKEINEDGEHDLEKLKVTTSLSHKFLLDYRLTQSPDFQSEYFDSFHKGEIYWQSEPTVESPLVPPPMPDRTDTGSMLYLWISDYMFDTIGYQAQKHGFLAYNMTQRDLPSDNRGVLNTTCEGFIPKCVGRLIPQIGQKYPNQVVELRMNSTIAPTMKITSGGVTLSFAGIIDLYAYKPGQSTSDSIYLVTLNAIMDTTVTVSVQNELIYAKIQDLNLKLKVAKSAVGNVSDDFLDFLVNQALKSYLIPQLNDLGMKGFPLLVGGDVKFENTKIILQQDTIQIGTDLKYTPSSSYRVGDQDGPLKFKPHVEIHNN